MTLYVVKHPDAYTLAACYQSASEAPPEAEAMSETDYGDWTQDEIAEGWAPAASSPRVPTEQEYVAAVQSWLDQQARSRSYDNILSACTYATSEHPRFGPDGQAAVIGRDAAWGYCYAQLAAVLAGERPQPTVAELLSELTPIEWPE